VSEGKLERVGFFDRVNPRDTVVREPPKPAAAPSIQAKPAGQAKPAANAPVLEVLPATYVWSTLFDRVRSLY
jgi:hypothetical protein